MAPRRALVTAPLAVLVAIGAHWAGFGAEHALGGFGAGAFLAVGLGGLVLLALAAVGWAAAVCRDARTGERRLLAFLPGRGGLEAAAALAGYGFVAFAAGEALEGRSALGTWATALALIAWAVLVAFIARRVVRWLAAGGVLLAAILAPERRGCGATVIASAYSGLLSSVRNLARGTHRGRAPPLFA